jgi:TIR domain-containing protein
MTSSPESEPVDWKDITPDSLIDAVAHVRECFEEQEFGLGFVTQQRCYKELHSVSGMAGASTIFKSYLDFFEEGLKGAIRKGFDDLFEIGLANERLINQRPIDWAKTHFELLITGKEHKIRQWIKTVCDQQEMSKTTTPEEMEEFIHWHSWRAPFLIVMQPSGNMPFDSTNAWSRATEEDTEKFLHGLSKRFFQGLDFHLDDVAGEAHVKLAKQGRQSRLPPPQKQPGKPTNGKEVESGPPADAPAAFISYSWDSEAHKQWVFDLATQLRSEGGVRIILDRWHLPVGGDRTVFMEKSIATSTFVILICTPSYAAKANDRLGGAGYEAMIITGELAENLHQRKFIPVLRDGDWQTSLPTWIKTRFGIDLKGDPYSDVEYEKLLRAIHSETLSPPAVGPKPTFENSSGRPLSKVSATRHSDLRIYPYEKSCFTLVTSLDRSQLMGMHVNLDLAIENRGNKGSTIVRYDIYVREADKTFENIRPNLSLLDIRGRFCVRNIGNETRITTDGLIRIQPDTTTIRGFLPFFPLAAPIRVDGTLHCRLTMTDTDGNSVSQEFELHEV